MYNKLLLLLKSKVVAVGLTGLVAGTVVVGSVNVATHQNDNAAQAEVLEVSESKAPVFSLKNEMVLTKDAKSVNLTEMVSVKGNETTKLEMGYFQKLSDPTVLNEETEKAKFAESNAKFFDAKRMMYYAMAKFHTTIRLFDGLMYILVVCLGAIFIMRKEIEPADLTAFLLMVSTLLGSIRQIVQFSEQFQRGMTGVERFTEIMEIEGEDALATGTTEMEKVKGNIEFKDVTFSYSDESSEVLHNVNISIKEG